MDNEVCIRFSRPSRTWQPMSELSGRPRPRSGRNQFCVMVASVRGKVSWILEKEINESLIFFKPIARSLVSRMSTRRAEVYRFWLERIRRSAGVGRIGVVNSFSEIVYPGCWERKEGDVEAWLVRSRLNE